MSTIRWQSTEQRGVPHLPQARSLLRGAASLCQLMSAYQVWASSVARGFRGGAVPGNFVTVVSKNLCTLLGVCTIKVPRCWVTALSWCRHTIFCRPDRRQTADVDMVRSGVSKAVYATMFSTGGHQRRLKEAAHQAYGQGHYNFWGGL